MKSSLDIDLVRIIHFSAHVNKLCNLLHSTLSINKERIYVDSSVCKHGAKRDIYHGRFKSN